MTEPTAPATADAETALMEYLVAELGGHSVTIVRDGERLIGWCAGRAGRSIAIRDLIAGAAFRPKREAFNLAGHLRRQRSFSFATFGPGPRTKGVVDHIRKELEEIDADPNDIMEWVDVIILAFDGAWRAGWEPEAIVSAIVAKQTRNEARDWPDWRTADPDKAIEHVRDGANG